MISETSPSRRVHITRLPSSALLSSKLRDQLAKPVRIVTLNLKDQSDFLTLFTQNEPLSDSPVQWDLYQTVDDATTLHLIARNAEPPQTDLNLLRSNSGMLDHDSQVEQKLSAWLGKSKNLLTRPYSSVRAGVIAQHFQEHSAASSEGSSGGGSASTPTASDGLVIFETLRIKHAEDEAFALFCAKWMGVSPEVAAAADEQPLSTGISTKADYLASIVKEELGIEVKYILLRDLDNLETFRVLYFFKNSDECVKTRESRSWRLWRNSISRFLLGPVTVCQLRKILYSGQTNKSRDNARLIIPTRRLSSRLAHHDEPLLLESDLSKEVGARAVTHDERLANFQGFIRARFETYQKVSEEIRSEIPTPSGPVEMGALINFANGVYEYGLVQIGVDEYRVREYLPGAESVHIYGAFNEWDRNEYKLEECLVDEAGTPTGKFSLIIKNERIKHLTRYKLIVTQGETVSEKPCPFSKLTWKSETNPTYDSIFYQPEDPYIFKFPKPNAAKIVDPDTLRSYEVNIGLCSDRCEIGTYHDCVEQALPRIQALKMNTLILTGVMEHSYFPSGGWHVNSYFAPCSMFGSPDDLKKLVDRAHEMGIRVVVSLVLSHAGPSECDGLGRLDTTEECGGLFRKGMDHRQTNWDGLIFDFASFGRKFMLSVIRYWMEEFRIDGFRMEGLSSVLYKDHALNGTFDRFHYNHFFEGSNTDLENQAFLMVVNDLVKSLNPDAVTIASDVTQTPTLGLPISEGGIGFDYVMSHHVTQTFSRMVEQIDQPSFSLNALRFDLDRLSTEKRVASVETLDTMVIGKRPMKIAFFAWETLHTIAVGGIAPHVTELAAALRRCGHEVHIFTRACGMQSSVSVHYGVHYHQVTFDLNRDFIQECQNMCSAFVSHMLGWENETGENFSIVHGHDWLAGRAICALKGLGRTCVFTMHSTEAGRCGNQVFGGDSARIRHIEREACMVANRVICVSGVLAEEVKSQYGIDGQKIRVVYNGCNVQNFDGFEVAGPIKEGYNIQPMEPTILFVGRFVVQKGVDLLIEAIPSILKFRGDTRFVIVGDGHMRTEVERRAGQLGVAHACRFVGAKGGTELKSLFKMCDAVIVPSRNEPFGIVVLEAWSAFKPVIATTCGGPRDFVTPGVDGILVDPNPSSIAWGVCELLQNFDHARWMGERGRVKAAYSFSWDTIGRQTRDIYYELINKSDSAYCVNSRGDCSLAQRTMGDAVYYHMGIFDDNEWIRRGLSLLRIAYLLTISLAGEASMVSFGSEFGHPDWIDFPRAGNNFSHQYARRQWGLGLRKELKYKHTLHFYSVMNEVDQLLNLLNSKKIYVLKCSEEDKVLAFERDSCLVVVNFNPDRSFNGFGIGHSLLGSGVLRHVLDTDETRFGGYGRLETRFASYPPCEAQVDESRAKSVQLYLPSRTALILTTEEKFQETLAQNEKLAAETPDQFIDQIIKDHPHLQPPC